MDIGGAEVLVAQLCRLQQRRGHRPAVHCLLRKGPLGEALERDGIAVSTAPPGRLERYRAIRSAIRRARPAVVHCHNANAAIQAALLARLAGVRAILTTRHGLVPPDQRRGREIKFWIAARFCGSVVAVCDAARQNLLRGPGAIASKIVTIRNGSAPASAEGAAAPRTGVFTLVTVARLAAEKDQSTMLRAFAAARASGPPMQLRLVGDGPLRAPLESLAAELGIADAVWFAGARSDVGAWLAAADLFVLSSVSEGLPVSVLEAMAAGLPMLLTNVGGMPEMARLAGGGRIVEPRDVPGMAAAMAEMARDRDGLRRMGEANRAVYREQLTDAAMCDAYQALYDRLLAR
jgi:glycosyltransferase involved in cell wall biosynthesis